MNDTQNLFTDQSFYPGSYVEIPDDDNESCNGLGDDLGGMEFESINNFKSANDRHVTKVTPSMKNKLLDSPETPKMNIAASALNVKQ